MAKEPVTIIYEHSSDSHLEGNYRDGMEDMLGDDILSSDYDVSLGEPWPGVNLDALPPEWEAGIQRLEAMQAAYRAAHPEAEGEADD